MKRSVLKNSSQPELQQIWSDTTDNHIITDTLLLEDIEIDKARRKLQNDLNTKAGVHIWSLVCQGEPRCMMENISKSGMEYGQER